MDKFKRILSYTIVGLVGAFASVVMSDYVFEPKNVYEKDLNGDGKKDLVVERRNGEQYGFLQISEGKYIKFEDAITAKIDSLVDVKNSEIRNLESKLK